MQESSSVKTFYEALWSANDRVRSRENVLNFLRRECFEWSFAKLGQVGQGVLLHIGPGDGSCLPPSATSKTEIFCDMTRSGLIALRKSSTGQASLKRAMFIQADANRLPLISSAADAAYLSSVLMHLDLGAAFDELHRVLKPGARVVIVEPLRHHPLAILFRFTKSPFKKLAPSFVSRAKILELHSGFNLVDHREFFITVPFLAAIARSSPPNWFVRSLLNVSEEIDSMLLKAFPVLRKLAWMSAVELIRS